MRKRNRLAQAGDVHRLAAVDDVVAVGAERAAQRSRSGRAARGPGRSSTMRRPLGALDRRPRPAPARRRAGGGASSCRCRWGRAGRASCPATRIRFRSVNSVRPPSALRDVLADEQLARLAAGGGEVDLAAPACALRYLSSARSSIMPAGLVDAALGLGGAGLGAAAQPLDLAPHAGWPAPARCAAWAARNSSRRSRKSL